MWYFESEATSKSDETLIFEFQQPPRQPLSAGLKKQRDSQNSPVNTNEVPTQEQKDLSEPSNQVVTLQGSMTHPYFKKLWQILKKKKQNIQFFSKSSESYFVIFNLRKSGFMENIKVSGHSSDVINLIHQTLVENAELPPVPDEVSLGDIQIQYQVDI